MSYFTDLEKNNDNARSVVRNQCNGQNPAAHIMWHEHRDRVLSEFERVKRVHTKRKNDYWEKGIKDRGKRPRSLNFNGGKN